MGGSHLARDTGGGRSSCPSAWPPQSHNTLSSTMVHQLRPPEERRTKSVCDMADLLASQRELLSDFEAMDLKNFSVDTRQGQRCQAEGTQEGGSSTSQTTITRPSPAAAAVRLSGATATAFS